ncbi:MAG: hypothetical protein BRC49_06850 [Cyanobacteria bacterium SW_10_48_33]|nr:MAG: hypothetical protein BRC49_06850 [Cyanobacteria bacterium SW_10_48_33]
MELPRTVLQLDHRSTGSLVARSQTNWASWGERIFFKIQPGADDITRVTFRSRPQFRFTIVDYGKNLENVERIRGYLTQYEA